MNMNKIEKRKIKRNFIEELEDIPIVSSLFLVIAGFFIGSVPLDHAISLKLLLDLWQSVVTFLKKSIRQSAPTEFLGGYSWPVPLQEISPIVLTGKKYHRHIFVRLVTQVFLVNHYIVL